MIFSLNEAERHALLLSTLAGLSTSIGGAIAVRALKPLWPLICTWWTGTQADGCNM